MTLQPVRGTHDLFAEEECRHRTVVDVARAITACYGFQAIATPIFEFTDVFVRTIGETSDIVSKEMYSFTDRSGDSITLRPENTAGVARAAISNRLTQSLPLRFFYHGPMFRHERPQKGRLRQFHQIGVELIGAAQPLGDVETIACGVDILRALGVWDRVRLTINSLGDSESRLAYRSALVGYFRDYRDKLSKDSLDRLEKNPLRILDSKDPYDREIVRNAPLLSDYLTEEAKDFFSSVKEGLCDLDIDFNVDAKLVRGLDYYCHTAFEFITESLGSQGTVMGGGRYDGLIGQMGGPETPGVGWAAGIERLAMMIAQPPPPPRPIALIPLGGTAERRAVRLAHRLRQAGVAVDLGYSGNLKKRLARANKIKARLAVIFGDDELALGTATIRDLDDGQQHRIAFDALVTSLSQG